jgi:hypothetical protein
MNWKSKVLLAYLSPCFAFILFLLLPRSGMQDKVQRWAFGPWFAVYFLGGVVVVPILLWGLPSIASLKTALLSGRTRQVVNRKLQRLFAATLLAIWMWMISKHPPQSAISITFDLLVFLLLIGAVAWLQFAKKVHPS